MPSYYEIRDKAKKAQKKRGGATKYEEKMKAMHGSIHKLKKIKKNTKFDHLSHKSVRTTPKANMNRVIAQIRTKAAREEYDADPPKYTGKTVKFDIMMVPMKKQHFPIYPSTRKGREGEVLTFEERRKQHTELTRRVRLYKTILNHEIVIPKRYIPENHEIDIEKHEVDQDYGNMDSLGDDYE